MSDTVSVPIPVSAVEAIQQGASVHNYSAAFRDVRDAILATDLPAPADPPGTVYTDPDGDLWIVGPNGKAGLIIVVADADEDESFQSVNFVHDEVPEDWPCVYRPGDSPEVAPPTIVTDCEGDQWVRQADGTYSCADGSITGYSFTELAKDYPTGFGPLVVEV